MDGFVIPLAVFTVFMVWLLVEVIRGSFSDEVPLRAGVTWAITCPVAGLLFGIGVAPLAYVCGAISMLALGSLAFWFLATEEADDDDPPVEPVEPDPSPSDGIDPDPYRFPETETPEWVLKLWEPKVLTTVGDSHEFGLPA